MNRLKPQPPAYSEEGRRKNHPETWCRNSRPNHPPASPRGFLSTLIAPLRSSRGNRQPVPLGLFLMPGHKPCAGTFAFGNIPKTIPDLLRGHLRIP